MRKLYSYDNVQIDVHGNTLINFEVDINFDAPVAFSTINLPDRPANEDPQIENSGNLDLGRASRYKNSTIIIFCNVESSSHATTEMEVEFKINGDIVLSHTNPKPEESRPMILFGIKFL